MTSDTSSSVGKGKGKEVIETTATGLFQYSHLGSLERRDPFITALHSSGINRSSTKTGDKEKTTEEAGKEEEEEKDEGVEEELRREKIAMEWLTKKSSNTQR